MGRKPKPCNCPQPHVPLHTSASGSNRENCDSFTVAFLECSPVVFPLWSRVGTYFLPLT